MSLQTPRVLPTHLHAFHPSNANPHVTSTVRLLGTVTALRGDTATITCGNNGDVPLILKPDSHLQMGKLVEVVGKVTDVEGQGLGLRVLGSFDWGNPSDCDYKIYENVVNATHRFKSLFYEAAE
ncbi:replication factor A protein 3 [Aspergillus bertholletiae]|uniref:Replication factor A protein 3 n=1 Tax=Aspergillus bertholletiae TaxID=1226010 RepID=A0A5N7B5W1_9EURO|nr:replication factor A protein 3 [Aspergillus bertholletiae]